MSFEICYTQLSYLSPAKLDLGLSLTTKPKIKEGSSGKAITNKVQTTKRSKDGNGRDSIE